MKPDVKTAKYLLAESEQQTAYLIIQHLFDTSGVETFDYQIYRVSLIIIRFTRRYYIRRRQRLKSVCVTSVIIFKTNNLTPNNLTQVLPIANQQPVSV